MMPRRRAKSKQRATTATTVENDILSTFQKLDQDDSGSLSENELFKHFQDVGLPKKLVKKLIKAADIDSNGFIDFDEFRKICLSAKENDESATSAFVESLFGSNFFITRELIGTSDLFNSSLEPLRSALQKKSVAQGLSPRASGVDGGKRRYAPCAVRMCSECLDCCVFTPLFGILLFFLLSPFLFYLTDDIYRLSKNVACSTGVPKMVFNMALSGDPVTLAGINTQVDNWCDPTNGCPESYYMLGVDRNATGREIRRGYRRATLEYHPDKACSPDLTSEVALETCQEKYNALFTCLNEAKETLLDDKKRQYYDVHGNLDEFEHMMNEWTWSFIVGAGYMLTIQLAYWMVLMFRCCWCRGQGPGKYVIGLQVVDSKGAPASCCTMFLRSMIKICGFVLFPLIFWIMLKLAQGDAFYYVVVLFVGGAQRLYAMLNHYVVWKR